MFGIEEGEEIGCFVLICCADASEDLGGFGIEFMTAEDDEDGEGETGDDNEDEDDDEEEEEEEEPQAGAEDGARVSVGVGGTERQLYGILPLSYLRGVTES